jgi:hypothetical protein
MTQESTKKIFPLDLSRLHNAEHYQFGEDFLVAFPSELAESLNLSAQRGSFLSDQEKAKEVFLVNRKFDETENIKQADADRDKLMKAFIQSIASYAGGSGTTVQQTAAEAVGRLLEPYRGAPNKSYVKNTAELGKFVEDVQKAPYAAHLTTLGLTDAVARLKVLNDNFHTLYNSRSEQLLDRKEREKMTLLRKTSDKTFDEIVEDFNVLYRMETDAERKLSIGDAIDRINALIIQWQRTLASRGVKTPIGDGSAGGGSTGGNGNGNGGDTGGGGDENPGGGGGPLD